MVRTKFNGGFTRKKLAVRGKPGPKSTFKPEIALKAYKMALYGMTEKEMMAILNVSANTWEKWKRDHPILKEKLEKGKLPADTEVASALYKRCTGFFVDDTYITVIKGQIVTVPIKKYFPPDTKAIQMWLSNRSKGRWSTVTHHKVEHSGEVLHRQQQTDLSDFSTEELKVLKKYAVLQN